MCRVIVRKREKRSERGGRERERERDRKKEKEKI
jgi:hypothetical protein